MEKPKKNSDLGLCSPYEHQKSYDDGYDSGLDDYEAYNKWVIEPVVEVFEKHKKPHSMYPCSEIWKAIQETIQRSRM